MSVIYISGAGDDQIVIDGDLQVEFLALDRGEFCGGYLAFSDGSVVNIFNDTGVWRIMPVFIDPDSDYLREYEGEPEPDAYSDVARLSNSFGFKWVVLGKEFSKRRREPLGQMEIPGV